MLLERFIHSLKTVLAVGIGFLVVHFITFPADQWIIITILVVMCTQLYVGSVLQKSFLRFVGTTIGCLFAIICLEFFGLSAFNIGVALAVSSFCFSFIGSSQENLAYAGTLGAVTVPIILLGQHPTVLFAASRFLEISLGLLIATLVSQFILPIHARTHLKRAQIATLKELQSYYTKTIIDANNHLKHEEQDEKIVKSLLKQRVLAKDSVNEPLGQRLNPKHFAQCLYCEREILRAITFMHLAQTHLTHETEAVNDEFKLFHEAVNKAFAELIGLLKKKSDTTNFTKISPPTSLLTANTTDRLYLDGYLFNAEILSCNLNRLAGLLR